LAVSSCSIVAASNFSPRIEFNRSVEATRHGIGAVLDAECLPDSTKGIIRS
jgi:hypothetical protein